MLYVIVAENGILHPQLVEIWKEANSSKVALLTLNVCLQVLCKALVLKVVESLTLPALKGL